MGPSFLKSEVLCTCEVLLFGLQELVKLRAMRLGPGTAQRPAAPEDDDEWSTVGRRGAKTTTRGDECLAVRQTACVAVRPLRRPRMGLVSAVRPAYVGCTPGYNRQPASRYAGRVINAASHA